MEQIQQIFNLMLRRSKVRSRVGKTENDT